MIPSKRFAPHPDLDLKLCCLRLCRDTAEVIEPMTLVEIAACVGVSHQAIHAIQLRAMEKLRLRLGESTNSEVGGSAWK